MRCNVSSVVITLYKLWAERSRSREGRRDTNLYTLASLVWVEHHQMTKWPTTHVDIRFIISTSHTFLISLLSECAENQFRIFLLHISLPRAALLCTGSAASAASAAPSSGVLHTFFRSNLHIFARQQLSSPSLHNLGWGLHPLLRLMIIVWWREDVVITGFALGVTANLLILLIFKYEFQICHHHFTV